MTNWRQVVAMEVVWDGPRPISMTSYHQTDKRILIGEMYGFTMKGFLGDIIRTDRFHIMLNKTIKGRGKIISESILYEIDPLVLNGLKIMFFDRILNR